jgi:lysophospholipase L1-like esterase
MKRTALATLLVLTACGFARSSSAETIYETNFAKTRYGHTPSDWRDLVNYRPARNWAVDGNGLLRVMLKEYVGDPTEGDRLIRRKYLESFGMRHFTGLLAYEGPLPHSMTAAKLADLSVIADFRKTPDPNVTLGVFARLHDRDNYYVARFRAAHVLEIVKFVNNQPTVLATRTTDRRYHENDTWTIEFKTRGDLLTARLLDERESIVARCDARDGAYTEGSVGLAATTFAAVKAFWIVADAQKASARKQTNDPPRIEQKQSSHQYAIVRAATNQEQLNTQFDNLAKRYDVVVAGGGTGGFGAAVQAARLGASVLLLEETDLIGGQMANAGVTSMDEGGQWGKNPVRERGIYREFHESAVAHYYSLNKDPFTAYHYNRQSEAGFEPHVARGILYGLIDETRQRQPNGKPAVLDLAVRTRVVRVEKQGDTIVGATLEEWTEQGPQRRDVQCHVLVDATEYGDVMPLAGVRYRVGTCTSDGIDPAAPMQEYTWLGVIREYPDGIPPHLVIQQPPPDYEAVKHRFRHYSISGESLTNKNHKGRKVTDRAWFDYVDWRGMADSVSPATGELTEQRHTRGGLNGGNDYPVTAATCEDMAQRRKDELWGIHRSLGIIYWFQHELGLPWAPPEDEGYAKSYNLAQMRARGVREDLLPIAALMPQLPYARESRRMIGLNTLKGNDLAIRDSGENRARPWASSVAINDYSLDLHGTNDQLEADLDTPDYINGTGPFMVPFEVFIPERVDGFVPAEKNISQSRLVNGATRLQPSTMLNGQAAGTIAALAALQGKQPRELNIIEVQSTLLASGVTLIPRWYEDVEWGAPLWQATQLLSLYGMMDRQGPLRKDAPLGIDNAWGINEPLDPRDANATFDRSASLKRKEEADNRRLIKVKFGITVYRTRAEFALKTADRLRKSSSYSIGDLSLDDTSAYDAAVAELKKKMSAKPAKAAKSPKPTDAPAKTAPRKIQNASVVILGDSLSTNNGTLGPKRGYYHWTDSVKQRFNLKVTNLGKGGSRADAGLERLTKALVDEKQRPDFVIINFGMNDHKIAEKDGKAVSSAETFEQQLTAIVKLTRSMNAVPILVAPHAIYEGSPDNPRSYYSKYTPANFEQDGGALKRFDTFIAVIRKVAKVEGVDLIDLRKESAKYDGAEYTLDGVHMGKLGHENYARTINNYLAEKY